MIQHIVLQGDTDLREAEFATADALATLLDEGLPRFFSLGIRTHHAGQEVRAFWSIPDHGCGVRLVQDEGLGVVVASVEAVPAFPHTRVVGVLTTALPSVSVDVILASETKFEEMPELVFCLALATRHAPPPHVVEIVKRLVLSSNEAARVSAVGAAVLLGGPELTDAVRVGASRGDLSSGAKTVFDAGVRDLESHAADSPRSVPFGTPEEVFQVRW